MNEETSDKIVITVQVKDYRCLNQDGRDGEKWANLSYFGTIYRERTQNQGQTAFPFWQTY